MCPALEIELPPIVNAQIYARAKQIHQIGDYYDHYNVLEVTHFHFRKVSSHMAKDECRKGHSGATGLKR